MLATILNLLKTILWDGLFSKILSATSDKVAESVSDAVAERVGKTLDGGQSATELGDASHVVPKGLRYFDEHDAGFFLKLLPGPYREDGLPESLHFWKTLIEETDADKTFRVGVIYGPSGCGKSSLVRAGLIPHLDDNVIPILIEATPDDTEKQLLGELKKHASFLNPKTSLRAALRRKNEIPSDKKLLIVLDQFEQWLHGRDESEYEELAEAIGECDGAKIQCLLMIRDDFWTPLTEFMYRTGDRIRDGDNAALVNRFGQRHAKDVLILFGQAYDALPASGTLTPAQEGFVDQAVDGLAENGRVICVRLALFAQMVQRWEWEPTTLKRLGGTEGVGVAFLEESLAAKEAPASVRQHQQQAEAVLRALLPEQGTDIKGARRSRADLLEQSGYGRRPDEFSELLEILDTNLRLITPSQSTDEQADDAGTEPVEKHYQLTHDYLVPSLREWLTRKQRETRRGRAELRLSELSQSWNDRPENRHLPGPHEYVSIRCLTKKWTDSQRTMIRCADRYYAIRAGAFVAVMLLLTWIGTEMSKRNRAQELVPRFLAATEAEASRLLPKLISVGRWAVNGLEEELARNRNDEDPEQLYRRQSNAAVALASLGHGEKVWPVFIHSSDPTLRSYLINRYAGSGGDPGVLLKQLSKESDASIRRALILALGQFDKSRIPDSGKFITLLLTLHEQDLDPGIHGATDWVLRRWQREKWLADKDRKQWESAMERLATGKLEGDRQWYVTIKNRHTMAVLPGGEHWYGDSPKKRKLDRPFAVSTTEVTVEQFRRFLDGREANVHPKDYFEGPFDDSPIKSVTWFLAAEYCNWLSDQEGIPKDQRCYEPNEKSEYDGGMKFYSQRIGYRLPTEQEWEYACRAATSTRNFFGDANELLLNYGNCTSTYEIGVGSTRPVASFKPNDFGLFDMHGNVSEWCQTEFDYFNVFDADSPETEYLIAWNARTLRGGSFTNLGPRVVMSNFRSFLDANGSDSDLGFRVARTYN